MPVQPRLSFVALLLPLAAGCPQKGSEVLSQDTAAVGCDLLHGATGILQYDTVSGDQHHPNAAPDEAVATTSVAGPFPDGSWLAMFGNEVLTSTDACNWDSTGGRLPAGGTWELRVVGDNALAIDRAGSQLGLSSDGGLSWAAADAGEPFFGEVQLGADGRLRGLQARGLVTSEDGGQTWTPSGTPPPGAPAGGAVFPGNLDVAAVAYNGGVAVTDNGGESWEDIGADLVADGFIAKNVAFSEDSADIVWVSGADATATGIRRTVDGGERWTEVATSRSIDLADGAPLWPVPGAPNEIASAYGAAGEGVTVYRILAGDELRSAHWGTPYVHLNDVAFTDDGVWLLAVDAVE